jgi:hypothetical protein
LITFKDQAHATLNGGKTGRDQAEAFPGDDPTSRPVLKNVG